MSTEGFGSFRLRSSSVSAMMLETARLRNHLWFAGMTNQGACSVEQRDKAASKALM